MKKQIFFSLIALCIIPALFLACTGRKNSQDKKRQGVGIAVFIPGVMSGSPIYEMLAQGAGRAADEFNLKNEEDNTALRVTVTVIEGGFNQAEWENQITVLAASGAYDLIVSSNPSIPALVSSVSAKFPEQKFLLMDGEMAGNPSVYTLRYNQREQAYMAGYIAALITLETGRIKRLGLVAAQEYPVMNNTILPGYLEGAQAVDPDFSVDFRIIGNWSDAIRAADLTADMIRQGVTVILPIAGGANEGTAQAAAESGAKVIWFDTNGYDIRPGTVAGSTVLYQEKATYEKIMLYLEGELPFGSAELAGITGAYVDFIQDDPLYIAVVSPVVREKQAAMIERIKSGELILDDK